MKVLIKWYIPTSEKDSLLYMKKSWFVQRDHFSLVQKDFKRELITFYVKVGIILTKIRRRLKVGKIFPSAP